MKAKQIFFLIFIFLLLESGEMLYSAIENNTINETQMVQYYPSGKKKAEGKKKDGKNVGKWIVWWENGNLARIINYDENGLYHGEQLFYAPDGSFVMKIYYIHGKKVSKEEFEGYIKNQSQK